MRRRITEILLYCLLLSLVFGGISVQAEENRKESAEGRILFISSYNYGWDTVQSQIEGIQAGVSDEAVVDYEFMDTKRVSDETSEQLFYEGLKYRLSKVAPYDVIILGDDAALLFAQKYREELFAEIPLVYEGVNNEQLAYEMSEDPLITGVIEKLSVEKNIVFAKTLLPDAKKVVAILDDSVTGRTIREQFFACEEKFPELTFSEINASELSTMQLKGKIRQLGKGTILIYICMTEDESGKQYSSREAVKLITGAATVPVFRMMEEGIGEGLLGGNVVSMRKSGEEAAGMAMDIINGKNSGEIGVVGDSPNIYCVDELVMKAYGLDMKMLPEGTKIVNYRQPFFQRNKEVLIPGGILIGMLLVVVLVSLIDNLRRRRLYRELEEARGIMENVSNHDFLTGIPNRSKLMTDLEELIRNGTPCTIFMIDIDEFKKINDTYGHAAGDDALRELAARMKMLHSQILMPYRYAGDEFIIIIQSIQSKIVDKTAMQCKELFSKPFSLAGEFRRVGGSIGIASFPKDASTLEELIECADSAMYTVKKSGKNRFAYYEGGKSEEK